jgi:hypothetical protein
MRLELGDATPAQLAEELRDKTDDAVSDDDDAASSAYGTPMEVIDESL